MRFSPWLTQSPLEEIFKSFYSKVESKLLKKFFSIFIMFNTKYIISRKWYWKEYWIDSARIEFAFIITCFVFRVNLSLTKKIQIRTKSKEQKIPFNNFSRNWVTWLQNKMLRWTGKKSKHAKALMLNCTSTSAPLDVLERSIQTETQNDGEAS